MPRTTPRSTPLKSSSGMNVALGSGCSPALPAKVAASSGALTVLMDSPSVRGAVAPAADKENDSPHATPRTLQRLEALQQQQTRRPRSLTEMNIAPASAGSGAGLERALSMCGTEGWLDVLCEQEGARDRWRRRYVRVQTGRMFLHVGHEDSSDGAAPPTPSKESAAKVVQLKSCRCEVAGRLVTVGCTRTATSFKLRAQSDTEAGFWAQDIAAFCDASESADPSWSPAAEAAAATKGRLARRAEFLAEQQTDVASPRPPGTIMRQRPADSSASPGGAAAEPMRPIGDLDEPSARKPDATDAAESPQAEGADSAETQVSREQLIAMAEAVGLDADLLDSMLDALDGDAQAAARMLQEKQAATEEDQAGSPSPQFQSLSCNGSFAVSNPVEGVSQAPEPRPARRFGRLRNALLRRGGAADDTRE